MVMVGEHAPSALHHAVQRFCDAHLQALHASDVLWQVDFPSSVFIDDDHGAVYVKVRKHEPHDGLRGILHRMSSRHGSADLETSELRRRSRL
jgi:hypothetical protein